MSIWNVIVMPELAALHRTEVRVNGPVTENNACNVQQRRSYISLWAATHKQDWLWFSNVNSRHSCQWNVFFGLDEILDKGVGRGHDEMPNSFLQTLQKDLFVLRKIAAIHWCFSPHSLQYYTGTAETNQNCGWVKFSGHLGQGSGFATTSFNAGLS